MADFGEVTTKRVEEEWDGVLWEVDIEAQEGDDDFFRLNLWRTKSNGRREQVQAEAPPQQPLTFESVRHWLFESEVPDELLTPFAERIVQARTSP